MMEDEERQKKLEAGKAKLAEYRQRKAHADVQKNQKRKKKKKRDADDPDGEGPRRGEAELDLDQSVGEEVSGSGGREVGGAEELDPSTTEFTFARTLRSGETVKHDQTYTIEPESELSTTAEDYSSEVNGCCVMTANPVETCKEFIWEEVEVLQKEVSSESLQVMEEELAAKTLVVEELSRELEEIRAAFGTEGVQQLQDFEAALKQRDGIITQLTANLQQSLREKDEVMREFLEMTEKSQKLHIQFQQLQAGETLRNTSHSSTAQDLLQAKQQLVQYQQQLEEMSSQVRGQQSRSEEQLLHISQLQQRLSEVEMEGKKTGESFAQMLKEKDLVIAGQKTIIAQHECSLTQLREQLTHVGRGTDETFAQTLNEKDLLISEQTAIITEHERTLNMLKVELAQLGRMTEETFAQKLNEKEVLIAEQERVVSERDFSLQQIKEELTVSERRFNNLNLQMTAKAQEMENCKNDLENSKHELDSCRLELEGTKGQLDSCRLELKGTKGQLDSCRVELERTKGELDSCRLELKGTKGQLDSCKVELEGTKGELDSCRVELERTKGELDSCKVELERIKGELDSCKVELGGTKNELDSCRLELETSKGELSVSKQKERMSSNEIQQLMGAVEDLQKRCHQGSLSDSDTLQRVEEDSARRLDQLRAELDEMYGEQIVQMKQELRLQHSVTLEQLTNKQCEELERLRSQQPNPSPEVVIELKGNIAELQQRLQEAQVLHEKARQELALVAEEKLSLTGQVEHLLQDLQSTQSQVEQVSKNFAVHESCQGELQRLQETVDNLKAQLVTAAEAAEEIESKHESEVTNYKIKLDMMEREKDAVLDRMAESQEAELERLRTKLLFSHEEELVVLRENLQRESQLNAENLLNEASIRHDQAIEELQNGFEDDRNALLHEIIALKDELKMALHSSNADKMVVQLKNLQVEAEELRKSGEEKVKMEKEIQILLKRNELLEIQSTEKEKSWDSKWRDEENEKRILMETSNAMKEEVASNMKQIQSLTEENDRKHRHIEELREEIEMQRNTFSFAEKNFEVNYQELKDEYTCLVEVKAQLEERVLKDTLVYESKLANLQSQIQVLRESKEPNQTEDKAIDTCSALLEMDTSEQMEKLKVALTEKEEIAARLSAVTEQLTVTEGELDELEGELRQVRKEHKAVTLNESLEEELKTLGDALKERTGEMEQQKEGGRDAHSKQRLHQKDLLVQSVAPACSINNHNLQIEALRGEVDALRSSLQAAEMELDLLRHTPETQRQSQTLALSAAPSLIATVGEGPVERSSAVEPLASGSDRRKTQQRRGKKKRQSSAQSKEKREEVAERNNSGCATAAAEREAQARMERQVPSSSEQRTADKDTIDRHHAERESAGIGNQADTVDGMERQMDLVSKQQGQDGDGEAKEHQECILQLEAQRVSLSQIHAAQLELLHEQTDARTHTLEIELIRLRELRGEAFTDNPKSSKYQNVVQVVSDECQQIILSFAKLFGEEFLHYLHHTEAENWNIRSFEEEEPREPSALLQDAKEMLGNLQQVKDGIELEHSRLLQLQSYLKADGSKFVELQQAYNELKRSREEMASLGRHTDTSVATPHELKALMEPSTASSHTAEDIQEQQAQLQESHRLEVERLRAYYHQQAREMEERHASQLTVLQQRLQECMATEAHHGISHDAQPGLRTDEDDTEELKLVEDEAFLAGLEAELHVPGSSMGLTAQLQTLRKALYQKYLQEVASLKELHRAELTALRGEKEEGEEEAWSRVKQAEEGINGGVPSIEEPSADVHGGQERRHQERVEEEIAKVIVQMSVEFAQQSELARITKSARETSCAVQTQSEEDKDQMEKTSSSPPTQDVCLEEVQNRFTQEKEHLEKELAKRTAELHRLKQQLLPGPSGFEQHSTDGELERTEREIQDRSKPLLKSQVSQAGKKTGMEDEEGQEYDKVRRTMVGEVWSQVGAGGLVCPDEFVTTERNLLRKANERLRQVLSDVLKTTAAAEETIGRHVEELLGTPRPPQRPPWHRAAGHPGDLSIAASCKESEAVADDVSLWSGEPETDKGLEMSQMMTPDTRSLLPGTDLLLENEEYLMNISARLQAAVEKLLLAITETTNQVEHAKVTQTELMRESFRHNQEMGDLLRRQEELQERLAEEGRAREQLALELHRAEGLIDGYTGERAVLEAQVRQKEELHLSLEQELQVTSSRLRELEQDRLQIQEEREVLSRQREAMREHAGPRELRLVEAAVVAAPEADLLEETEKLMAEKVEVQRQAEKESLDLLQQVKTLEAELEEQVNRVIELENAHRAESSDLQQQIQALEKQLEKNRRFLDEQAVDREHERDVFQQEIFQLEQQLRNSQKQQPGSEQRSREVDLLTFQVEQLTEQLREKADWCSELLLASEQLRREVFERDEEIDKLEGRTRELEQALLASTETVEEKSPIVSVSEPGDSILKTELQTEREALDRKEKEIGYLEEQLEEFREELEIKSEEVQQLHMQLEIQKKELNTQQEDLETKDSLLQVMEEKDREIALLNEQMAKLQQSETPPDNKEIDAREELVRELESKVEFMRSEQERLKMNSEEEVEQLSAVIDKLQEELANIERKHSSENDEELKGPLEFQVGGPSKEEYDEMKQKMDQATKDLSTIKAEHGSLLERYRHLQESRLALAECEKEQSDNAAVELQEALREKTAAFVVAQAQVQALEQNATSRVEELSVHIQELEACVREKDSELTNCRFLVEQAKEDADELQRKVQNLEDKLRDRVAAVLVSQAQLGAVQHESQQSQEGKDQITKETGHQVPLTQMEIPDFGIAEMSQTVDIQEGRKGSPGKVVLLTEKLRQLEVGLSSIQKDQELQKQLLSSSEEEVLEYEKRLVVLMDLLNQMKTKPGGQQRVFTATESSSGDKEPAASEILKELQEARDEISSTKEHLSNHIEISNELQQELKTKEILIAKLQEELQRVSSVGGNDRVSELHLELKEVKEEAAATKEELSSYRERCDKLQELLQEREMTIAHLKGELHQVQASSEGDSASASKLLQELQEVRDEAAATQELLNSFRDCSEKLQNELQVRDLSIAQLQEELHQLRVALAKTAESPSPPSPLSPVSPSQSPSPQLQQAPPSHPKKKGAKQDHRQGAKEKNIRAANQTSFTYSQSSGFNASRHLQYTHTGTQTETLSFQTSGLPRHLDARTVSEEDDVEEMMGEYQEKIVQMQELHAAEILDMEARHITESDALKRDAQMLEEECKALKNVIEKLQRTNEALSRPERPTGSQFKDGYTSDSSSDWSQRTGYDLPNLQQEFRTTPEGARREPDDALPDKIKNLLREVHQEGMQVLSLSELPIPEGDADSTSLLHHTQGWVKEKEALLASMESLKGLICQMQTHSTETQTPDSVDWRGELLSAVQQVFVKERGMLKSSRYSHLDQLDTSDAIVHLNQLEQRLAEQDAHHRDAVSILQKADRSSLLTEVQQLRAQLQRVQSQEPCPGARSVQEVAEPDSLHQADRVLLEELKAELAKTKLELETMLKTQHKHLKELDTLRSEASQKAAEVNTLTDRLAEEQKAARELQWAFEKEKCKSDRKEELEKEELEDLKLALEEQQNHVAQLTSALDQERQSSSQRSHRAEQELSRLQTQASQLHVQLESERARALELSSALGREKELRQRDSESSTEGGADKLDGGLRSHDALLEGLRRELDEKHAQVVRLLNEAEVQKLAAVQQEETLTAAAQRSREDREALREAKGQFESLGEQAREATEQLEREVQRGRCLEQEKDRLQERVAHLEEGQRASRGAQKQAEYQNQPTDRIRDWVFQQKSDDTLTVNSSASTLQQVSGTANAAIHHDHKHSDKVLGKLQLISAKIRSIVSKGSGRLTTEVHSEGLAWLQTSVDEVITMLQQPSGLPLVPESATLLAGGQSSSLTERLLRQNAELTGFVSRLTEEKNDLRNQALRLEDELRRYRQAGLGSGDSRRGAVDQQWESANTLFSSEREAWTRERSRLEKSLRLAQAEVTRLRGEIRTESLRDITGPEADNVTLKRMYGKYLRSESFRKALIYQKKYLLLLLGGFQECEEATLSLIARMGGQPSLCSLESMGQRRRGLTRFRSAVRVSIALSRMRFLVKRWHKATGLSSITSGNMNRNGLAQSQGNEVRTDSPYLHPGSVEVYGERRGASRGRTGRDSPRSALSSTQHRFHVVGDPGPMTCSHLQNYDPDRALTDYISRLEALQRRLGSVQSGSSSYAQLHFGIRR